MTTVAVEGFTAEKPVPDDDWADFVRWEVDQKWKSHAENHDRNGFFAEYAGSEQCLALGHTADEEGEWDDDAHPYGWDGDQICVATRYGLACTECESDECFGEDTDTRAFWELFSADGSSRPTTVPQSENHEEAKR
jgi:elongation factor P--beta-lysine ligase